MASSEKEGNMDYLMRPYPGVLTDTDVTDPAAWADLFNYIDRLINPLILEAGRRYSRAQSVRMVYFKYCEPWDEEYDCRVCGGAGEFFSLYHNQIVTCPHCAGGKVILPCGPGVIGHNVVIEEARVRARLYLTSANTYLQQSYIYRRGLFTMSRSGSTRLHTVAYADSNEQVRAQLTRTSRLGISTGDTGLTPKEKSDDTDNQ